MLKQATGQQGVVKYGPIPTATLRAWTLTACDDTRQRWSLTATAVNVNAFYATQAPHTVSLHIGKQSWRWKDVVLEIAGTRVSGTLVGRPEILR